MKGIKDKRILITGGSSGIGLATVKMLLKYKPKLGIGCYDSCDDIRHLASDNVVILDGDLTNEFFSKGMVKEFIKHFGGIDILINNAGTIDSKNFLELEVEDFQRMQKLNMLAPYFLMREAFKYMKANGGGKIINISSISVKYGGSEDTMHYAVSKIGIECMTTRFYKSGINHNILVNCIRPGYTDTPIHVKRGRTKKEDITRRKMIPLKRAGKPEEIGGLILYLCSDYGNFTAGEIITIGGGD